MNTARLLERFERVLPQQLAARPGVFIICRHLAQKSTGFEFLGCAEAEDVRAEAARIMTHHRIDGFENSIFYFVRHTTVRDERIALLNEARNAGIASM